MNVTNESISRLLNISVRTVQNKRNGFTSWTMPEYLILVKYYGEETADKIIKKDKQEEFALNYLRRN